MNTQTEINTQPELPFVPALSLTDSTGSNSSIPTIETTAEAGGSDPIKQLRAENEQPRATIRDAAHSSKLGGGGGSA